MGSPAASGMLLPLSQRVVRAVPVMGTVVSIDVRDADVIAADAESAVDAAIARLAEIEARFSTFRSDSEISRIDSGSLDLADAHAEVRDALVACAWLERESGGVFRARRPGSERLDPAGYVKGWAGEQAAAVLRTAGLQNWCVNLGGDIRAAGCAAVGRPWQAALRDPFDALKARAVIAVSDGALATSGTDARGLHLWDGRTGERVEPLASLTVAGPSLTWADAFATAAFAMGLAGLAWVARFDGYDALAVRRDGSVSATAGMAARLVA